ncbi:FtsX-like permease family protein [Calidifontibacter indicus]|uniref:FtsX-like permease family protein n=1 Tax=Calidifontibacter indicus TaxID=419650 RepID=A0A3D9V033_9MICO|nr:FtsX-like permease family protein [Calidifontibacter indicus]REF31574.1 FtsX-like permease family protein [Calidifontibacter indicus]
MTAVSTGAALGLRLALRAGRARAVTVVASAAGGLLVLLLSLDLPYALRNPETFLQRDDKIAYLILSAVVAAPVVVLMLTTSRLSSAGRDRRLSRLRLMGLSRGNAAVVALVETLALVTVGAALGFAAWLTMRWTLLHLLVEHGCAKTVPPAHVTWAVAATVGVLLAAGLSSVAPALRSARSALSQARTVGRARHVWWPLALLVVALVVGLLATSAYRGQNDQPPSVLPLAFCFFASISGLVLAGSSLTTLLGRALRRIPGATALLAGRRMEADRSATSRALAGLVIATFAAAFGLSVFTIFTTTPQYRSAQWAMQHETVDMTQLQAPPDAAMLERVRRTPGVTWADAGWTTTQSTDVDGVSTTVISCARLRSVATVSGCRDDSAWLVPSNSSRPKALPTVSTHGVRLRAVSTGSVHFDAVAAGGNGPYWFDTWSNTVVVPPGVMQRAGVRPDAIVFGIAPGARLPWTSDLPVASSEDWDNYDNVAVYRTMTYTLIAAVIAVGLLTVVINVIDRAAERRRSVAATRVLGTDVRVLRHAQFLGVVLPLLAGVTVAVVAGWVTGRTYLAFGDALGSFPGTQLLLLWGGACLGAVAVAALTLPGLGRPLSADLVRRE